MKGDRCEKCGVLEGTLRKACGRIDGSTKYGIFPVRIVHHHAHGYGDEAKLTLLCVSCHVKAHKQARKNGRCNISVEVLCKLTHKSFMKDCGRLQFYETLLSNVRFCEEYQYSRTGNVTCYSCFRATNGKELYYIDEIKNGR